MSGDEGHAPAEFGVCHWCRGLFHFKNNCVVWILQSKPRWSKAHKHFVPSVGEFKDKCKVIRPTVHGQYELLRSTDVVPPQPFSLLRTGSGYFGNPTEAQIRRNASECGLVYSPQTQSTGQAASLQAADIVSSGQT